MIGIGSALAGFGHGAFGINTEFEDEAGEIAWLTDLARQTGRPVWFLVTQNTGDPTRWKRLLASLGCGRCTAIGSSCLSPRRCVARCGSDTHAVFRERSLSGITAAFAGRPFIADA